jgi:MFS superfamily sulfate permease-like transporter
LAYATIAGVSPEVGLCAAPTALILYALFGSARHLVTGPMAATVALSAATVGVVAGSDAEFAGLTAALALVVGIMALAAGLLRLGFIANFISEPVLKGFIIGLALTIVAGQVPKLFGIEATDGNFFEKVWGFITSLDETNAASHAVGAVSLAVVLGLRRWATAVPGALVAVALGIAAVALFDLGQLGVAIVGEVPPGLPPMGLPEVDWSNVVTMVGAAAGVMLISFAEGLGAAKNYAARFHYRSTTTVS